MIFLACHMCAKKIKFFAIFLKYFLASQQFQQPMCFASKRYMRFDQRYSAFFYPLRRDLSRSE